VDALVSANVAVDISVVDKPRRIYPNGEGAKPLEMTHHARFGAVTLDTTCGPLVLRGLQAWIDDTASSVELIESRPVIEILGFSTDNLLVGAR
jgi:hypothetical protein